MKPFERMKPYCIIDIVTDRIASIHAVKPRLAAGPQRNHFKVHELDIASYHDLRRMEKDKKSFADEPFFINEINNVVSLRSTMARIEVDKKRQEQDDKIDDIISSIYDMDGYNEAFRLFLELTPEKREEALFRLAYRAARKANKKRYMGEGM